MIEEVNALPRPSLPGYGPCADNSLVRWAFTDCLPCAGILPVARSTKTNKRRCSEFSGGLLQGHISKIHSDACLEKDKTSEIVSRRKVFRERWYLGGLCGSSGRLTGRQLMAW